MAPLVYEIGLRDELMDQVNLVLLGRGHVAEGGSFTLTALGYAKSVEGARSGQVYRID